MCGTKLSLFLQDWINKNMSIRELSLRLGLPYWSVRAIIRGKKRVNVSDAVKLSFVLNLDPVKILDMQGNYGNL